MKHTLSLIALIAAVPALAEETRQLDAHEHGVGALNIAVVDTSVAMEFEAPGADIVGFEYQATSDEDLAAIEAALTTLSSPLDLFKVSEAAGCSLVSAKAELETEDEHDDHDDHGHDDHGDEKHDDHDDEKHDDHGHDDHAHDDHEDDKHDDHDDHGHEDHADEAGHTEFHAEYVLTCDTPDALTTIDFAYFETFPNAQEVDVQMITSAGAKAYEVERDTPRLTLD